MAVKGRLVPNGMEPPEGVIAIETREGAPTVIAVEDEMELDVAVIEAAPWPELVARP